MWLSVVYGFKICEEDERIGEDEEEAGEKIMDLCSFHFNFNLFTLINLFLVSLLFYFKLIIFLIKK